MGIFTLNVNQFRFKGIFLSLMLGMLDIVMAGLCELQFNRVIFCYIGFFCN